MIFPATSTSIYCYVLRQFSSLDGKALRIPGTSMLIWCVSAHTSTPWNCEIPRRALALGVLICPTSSNQGFSWDLTNKHINMLIWDDLGHSIDIVTDIHLEHNLENEHQRFTWGMCSKYPLRTPTKNIHLEQVF